MSVGRICPTAAQDFAQPCPHLPVLQELDVSGVVAVPVPAAQHPEPLPAHGVHQGPPVCQHLHLTDLQHAAIVSKAAGTQGHKTRAEMGLWVARELLLLKVPSPKQEKAQEQDVRAGANSEIQSSLLPVLTKRSWRSQPENHSETS